jgi:hypothetical protein
MALELLVPLSTEVIDQNPECVTGGAYRDGHLVIDLNALHQDHWQRLDLPPETPMHWGPTYTVEVQELSGLSWPMRYCITTAEGWYDDSQGQRHYFVPVLKGLCLKRKVSSVAMRAGVFLSIIAGVGCRKAAWVLEVLFHVSVGKSSIDRWIDTVAEDLPSADVIVEELNRRQPITEGHFDGYFPRGRKDTCVLVLRDEHGRIVATEEVKAEEEEQVKPMLHRLKRLGLGIKTFYIDHSQALRNAITAVYPEARIQYDYFHIIQNIWKKLWSYALLHRREVKARSQQVHTAWYRQTLEALAQTLWKQRYLLFKSDDRMTPEEQQQLVAIMEADPKVGKLRTFLHGVWHIFRDSRDDREAREALEALKKIKIEPKAQSYTRKALAFLEDHFEQMITYLKHDDVQRNSLAESGMRVLRRLEVGHDGFRTPKGRENCLRIYQAVKYLGWSVHNPPTTLVLVPRETREEQKPGVTLSPVGKGPPNTPCQAIATAVG